MKAARAPIVALAACLTVVVTAGTVGAKSIKDIHGFEPHFVLPPETTMVSVKDLGAVGDGKTDDTDAFKKAIEGDAPRGIYVPAGTYLVRDSLEYGIKTNKKKRVLLIGESQSKSIIKLADNSPGFNDPAKPKVFIHTKPPKQQGEQNMHQFVYHLTIEIGKGNAGAVALNYHSSNTGAVKDVTIRASDASSPGLIGLSCQDWDVGPANARYITVEGFKTGISLTRIGNYFVVEHATVRKCQTGVVAPTCSIRDLVVEDCAVPVKCSGQMVLVDAAIKGQGEAGIVVEKGSPLIRNLKTQGYALAVKSQQQSLSGPNVDEWSAKTVWNFQPAPGMDKTLNLTVEESPEMQYPQGPNEWVVMPKTGDISDALQQAIDAGARHIYIPGNAPVTISKTIRIRNNVERIGCVGVGMITLQTMDQPGFVLEDGNSKVVLMELCYGNYGSKASVGVMQASPRTLVLRHSSLSYETAPEGAGGKLFGESLVNYMICRKVHAWLRDMDNEAGGPDARNLTNDGGTMWVLGQKSEDFAIKLKTLNGVTELLGGTYRQNWDQSDFTRSGIDDKNRPPLFEAVNSHVSLTYTSWGPAKAYETLVRETRAGETKNLDRKTHGGGASLFVGYTKRP